MHPRQANSFAVVATRPILIPPLPDFRLKSTLLFSSVISVPSGGKNSGDIFSSYPGFLANYFVRIAFGAAVDSFGGLDDPILGIK